MFEMSPHLAEVMQRNSGYICTAPCYNLTVAMLSYYKCMYRTAVNTKMFSEKIFKSCSVKNRSRTEYSGLRKSGEFSGHCCEDIYRICNDKQYTLESGILDIRHYALENAHIFLN